jgi:SEC-C motif-containing protein
VTAPQDLSSYEALISGFLGEDQVKWLTWPFYSIKMTPRHRPFGGVAVMCNCGSNIEFSSCCEPLLDGSVLPETAEQLMRSRYTAYTMANVRYLEKTLAPESASDFDAVSTLRWAQSSKWINLQILSTKKGQASDKRGTVEFIATYEQDGQRLEHHEVSEFRKAKNGQWLFVTGDSRTHKEHERHPQQKTIIHDTKEPGRNDPCPCGSGKKYKKCCG